MSWWDTSNFTNLASQALKNAQKTIDKALDIGEQEKAAGAGKTSSSSRPKKSEKPSPGGTGDFWNSWLGGSDPSEEENEAKRQEESKKLTPVSSSVSTSKTSWSFGWAGAPTSEEESSSWSAFDLSKLDSKGAKPKTATSEKKEAYNAENRADTPKSPDISKTEPTTSSSSESFEIQSQDLLLSVAQSKIETETVDSSVGISESVEDKEKDFEKSEKDVFDVIEESYQQTEAQKTSDDVCVTDVGQSLQNQSICDVSVEEAVPLEPSLLGGSEQDTQNWDSSVTEDSVITSVVDTKEDSSSDMVLTQSDTESSKNGKTESILSFSESETIVTSSESGLDTGEKVTLDIPSELLDYTGPSTPLSEASIMTLSSPGQDDLESPSQTLSSQQMTSEYINISTTHIEAQSPEDYISSGSGSADIGAVASDSPETVTSYIEQEFLEKELPDLSQLSGNDSSDASKLDSSMDTCASGDTVVDQTPLVEKLQDSDNEHEIEKSDESLLATSPNTSFVKNMLEEAMADVSKPDDSSSSDNHSGGDKSEGSKGESEIDKSISGHESSDDIETTTSSDIEIISTPTPNGDRQERPFDLSPLRLALQNTVRRERDGHRRTDSQSSGSTYSKAGESDQMSPGRDSLERQELDSGDDELRAPDLSAVTEDDMENPYHPQKLLQGVATQQQHQFIKKLGEQAEILQHRENKLVQLSKENNDLLEANSILRNQLLQAEELREAEMTDLNTLTEEFTKRLSESERKLQNSIKEKEAMKSQLQQAQEELRLKAGDISKDELLAEKEEQIQGLLQEGEKLSKQQLQSNNIIKKLRVKEKENETLTASQKKKLEEQKAELDHLRKVCDAKEDLEKKQTEAINQLNIAVQKQENEILKYKGEEENVAEKHRSLQTALDNAYKEIADLHKMNAAQDSKAQEAALSAEVSIREQLKIEMEHERQQHLREKEALIMQVEDLRLSITRMERESNRREDMLRQEISDLQVQLQEDEARTQELTHSVSSATRPLLRQIENLQSNYNAQSLSWEKVEKNLTERLAEAQSQLAMAVERERMTSEKLMDQNVKLTTLESQNARFRQEKSQLLAQAEMDRAKIELLEEAKLNEMAQVEAVKNQMSKEMTELKKDKVFLETQLEMERTKVDTEKKRVSLLEDQIRLMERERPRSRGTPSPVSVSRQESINSAPTHLDLLPVLPQEDLLERTLMLASPNGSKMNLYESLRQSGAATLLENLQSQLKQREGEIIQLQSEISSLERTRESMAKELVNLTNTNEELQDRVQELLQLEAKYKDLDARYNAMLQMYGEKVEQAEELKLDLQDIKEMYKAQIDQLLTK